jgi:hypothetical protein
MSKVKYTGIDPDAIIDIQVSGHFYKQIVNSILTLGDTKTPEEFKKALEVIKEDTPAKDYFELTVRTLTALIFEIETKAKAQDKVKEYEIEVPEEKTS